MIYILFCVQSYIIPGGRERRIKSRTCFLKYLLAFPSGPPTCTKVSFVLLFSPLFNIVPGNSRALLNFWEWEGNCQQCHRRVKNMEGIFCANFRYFHLGWTHVRKYGVEGASLPVKDNLFSTLNPKTKWGVHEEIIMLMRIGTSSWSMGCT